MWYKITAERIGGIGRLNVRRVRPIFDRPDYHKWVVGESPPACSVVDLGPEDPVFVGGGLVPGGLKSDKVPVSGIPNFWAKSLRHFFLIIFESCRQKLSGSSGLHSS
jgi:hypothetical protein